MPFKRRNLHITQELKEEISGARNIFDIFYSFTTSTPRGAYPLWTGETITDCAHYYPQFYQKALEYRSSGAIRVVDNATYESEVSKYGECGAFVISGNNIRLPKITMYLKSFSSPQDIGLTLPAGLPNITGELPVGESFSASFEASLAFTGAFRAYEPLDHWGNKGGWDKDNLGVNFDASRCSSVYGASNTVQPPAVQVAMYIQVYNHVAEEANFDVSRAEELIRSYYTTMDQKINQAIEDLKAQAGSMIPDFTRMQYITQDKIASATNIRDGVRTVYYIERPCWFVYWDHKDPADRDQMIQWCSDIKYVCVTPSSGDNNRNNFDSQIVNVVKQLNSSYDTMQIYDSRYHLVPLTPGMYYNFSAGTFVSTNENPDNFTKSALVPQYNSAYGALVHKYSVKMNWIARNQPLTYVSHTDGGVINL